MCDILCRNYYIDVTILPGGKLFLFIICILIFSSSSGLSNCDTCVHLIIIYRVIGKVTCGVLMGLA